MTNIIFKKISSKTFSITEQVFKSECGYTKSRTFLDDDLLREEIRDEEKKLHAPDGTTPSVKRFLKSGEVWRKQYHNRGTLLNGPPTVIEIEEKIEIGAADTSPDVDDEWGEIEPLGFKTSDSKPEPETQEEQNEFLQGLIDNQNGNDDSPFEL